MRTLPVKLTPITSDNFRKIDDFSEETMKANRVNPSHSPYFRGKLSQAIFGTIPPVSEISGGPITSQSCDVDLLT